MLVLCLNSFFFFFKKKKGFHTRFELVLFLKKKKKFVGAGIFGLVSILMQRQAGELVGMSALTGFATLAVSVLFDYQ